MKLYIKHMVCSRCIMVVKSEFEKLGIQISHIVLGEVEISTKLTSQQKTTLANQLKSFGFELIDNKKSTTIEKIKTLIIDLVHHQKGSLKINLSVYLAQALQQDYSTLSNLFSEVEDTTIEKYYISHKIERVKELLMYEDLTLSEIAFQLNYSSVAYLSNQFKKVTGFSPSHYKKLKVKKRNRLEDL